MTYCSTYGSHVLTLVYSGTTLGDHIHGMQTMPQRMTAVRRCHNFWASVPVLDGRYPALVYEHTFLVYNEEVSELDYLRWYAELAQQIAGDPYPLEVRINDNVAVAFGNCYVEPASQKEPDTLLLHAAGVVELPFIGTDIPSVV